MKLTAKPYHHQEVAISFAQRKKYAVLGLEMGLGKTLCALAVAVRSKTKKCLIVVPAFLKENWKSEIDKFTEGFEPEIVSYSQLGKIECSDYTFIIADEAHYLKNHKAKRSKLFHGLVHKCQPEYMLLLSGTPIKNRTGEWWNLFRLIHMGGKLGQFNDFSRHNHYFKFQYYFSNPVTQWFGNREVTKFEGIRNVPELQALVKACRIRMKASDVLSLPATTEIDHVIKEKHKFDKDFESLIQEDLKENNETYMLVKKNNAIAKSGYTAKLASEIIENGEKVIVFTDHIRSAEQIASALGVKAISGKVEASERARRVQEFENSPHALALVATIPSLSVGVNLTSARYMIFNDLPFVPADLDQAKKRIHRIGQERKCFYYYVYISELDQKLQKMIYSKRAIIEKI